MNKRIFLVTVTIIILVSLAWVIFTPILFHTAEAANEVTAAHPGFFAPEFTLETPDGESVSLNEYQGRPVLVFLWASWCTICKATLPGLQDVYEDYAPRGFEILAVNTTFQDSLPAAEEYFDSQGYTFPFLIDGNGIVSKAYQMHAVPTAVLIGPDGIVRDVVIGSGMSGGFLRARLDEIYSGEE